MQRSNDPYGWESDDYDVEYGCMVHNVPCNCDEEPDDWYEQIRESNVRI